MEPFLWFLAGVFAVCMYVINRLFLFWEKKSYEKLKEERWVKKCCIEPTAPCECGEDCKYDLCVRDPARGQE